MDTSFGREIRLGDHWYLQQFSFMPIGPRIRIYAVNVDEKKKAEEALKESEEKYRSLFENMINGYSYCEMIFDEKGEPVDFVYLEINDAFEKLTGLKREAVVGRRVSEAIPGTKKRTPRYLGYTAELRRLEKLKLLRFSLSRLAFGLTFLFMAQKRLFRGDF